MYSVKWYIYKKRKQKQETRNSQNKPRRPIPPRKIRQKSINQIHNPRKIHIHLLMKTPHVHLLGTRKILLPLEPRIEKYAVDIRGFAHESAHKPGDIFSVADVELHPPDFRFCMLGLVVLFVVVVVFLDEIVKTILSSSDGCDFYAGFGESGCEGQADA